MEELCEQAVGRFPATGATLDTVKLTIRLLRKTDGSWIRDIPELPGVTVYGATAKEATSKAKSAAKARRGLTALTR